MIFRADEERDRGYENALSKFVGVSIDAAKREESRRVLTELIGAYGPVVQSYPHWHPIVAANQDPRSPSISPGDRSGYNGLDHTVLLRNGFITCPYSNAQTVIDSVDRVNDRSPLKEIATLSAEEIDAQLYHPEAHPVLVKVEWAKRLNRDGTIPASVAVPLILERELPGWRDAEVAETWDTMRIYFLGQPCGSRSSLFVDQETGQTVKTIWNALIRTGMYGPIKVGTR